MMIETKKSAREAGYLAESDLEHKPLAAGRMAEPILVKGERFFHRSDCEELLSKTEAKRRRLSIPSTAEPVKTLHVKMRFGSVWYDVYRVSDCTPTRRMNTIPPVEIDLLQAIYTVNQSAKRYRDAAQANYRLRQHGFARHSRWTKQVLYLLKDRGIAAAYRQGRLHLEGFNGNLALYRGEGYCFHSTLVPLESEPEPTCQEPIFVEATPKGTREGRLKDAVYTLNALDANVEGFRRLPRLIPTSV